MPKYDTNLKYQKIKFKEKLHEEKLQNVLTTATKNHQKMLLIKNQQMTEKFGTRSRIVSGGFGTDNRVPFTVRIVGVIFENLRQNFQQWDTKPHSILIYSS